MNEYMLIAKGRDLGTQFKDDSDRDMFMKSFHAWTEELVKKNLFVQADELSADFTKVIQSKNGIEVLDGPYSETKEAITGYFIIRAENKSHAIEITKSCPVTRFDDLELYKIKGKSEQRPKAKT